MLRRFLVIGLVISSLMAAALVLVVVALGVHWGGDSRAATEGLPASSDSALGGTKEYHSEAKGYSVRFPESWSSEPTSLDLDRTSTDVFFASPTEGEAGVVPTLSITRESLPAEMNVDDYLRESLGYLAPGPNTMSQPSRLEIEGMQGYLVDYRGFSRKQPVQITAAVLVKGDAGWEIVLAVPDGKRSEYRPFLAAILRSLTIH
jgi:hypothetical protein